MNQTTKEHLKQICSQTLNDCFFCGSFLEDTQPPSFGETCPLPQTVVADEGKTTAMVTWGPVIATDNDQATVTASPNVTSPHEFVEGSHTVIYTAKDPSQNTKFCHFIVNAQGRKTHLLLLIYL